MTAPINFLVGKKAIGISFVTQYVNLVIQFVSVMVLARIMSPSEIGTFSLAAMLMTMLHVFRDFGVTQYIIQERDLSREKIQSVMGVAILLALAVAVIMLALSVPVAKFYENHTLRDVFLVMSGSFAISPVGSVILGVLRRDGRLKAIFYIKTFSALCQVIVAIGLGLKGFGAVSLAWGNFAGILGFGLAASLFRPTGLPWFPRFYNMREILSFGSVSSAGSLANIAGTSAPELVIGKVMDAASVGYFSRATGLVQLFGNLITGALTPLVLPYFAQMRREGKSLDKPYLMSVTQLTAVAWPFYAVLILLAYPVTRALYGVQWDVSVPIARLLCIGGAIAAVGQFASQAMIGAGSVRSSTQCNLIVQPIRILAALAASSHGLLAMAAALVVAECIGLISTCWFLHRTIGVHPFELARACSKSALIMLCSAAVPVLVWFEGADSTTHIWLALVAGGGGALVGWVAGLILTRHPLANHVLPLMRLSNR